MSHPPISSNLQERWLKASRAAKELAAVRSLHFLVKIVGQLVQTPPSTGKFLGTSLLLHSNCM